MNNNMRKYIIINFFILMSILSCGIFDKKVRYSKEELEWFNVYNEKDVLVFQNLITKKKDTSTIVSKRIYTDSDKFRNVNQEIMDLRYTNNLFKNSTYYQNSSNMFAEHQPYPNKDYKFACSYLKSIFKFNDNTKILDKENLALTKKSFNSVYELIYERPKFHDGTDDSPEKLYWDKKYGIIKYITFKGEVWERINW